MCGDCTLQSSVEYEYFKERFSVSCAASFSKVSISGAAEWASCIALALWLQKWLATGSQSHGRTSCFTAYQCGSDACCSVLCSVRYIRLT